MGAFNTGHTACREFYVCTSPQVHAKEGYHADAIVSLGFFLVTCTDTIGCVQTHTLMHTHTHTHTHTHARTALPVCSFAVLEHNELARDHGNRLFYTDHTGETVPASDDEGDDVSAYVCVSAHALATM